MPRLLVAPAQPAANRISLPRASTGRKIALNVRQSDECQRKRVCVKATSRKGNCILLTHPKYIAGAVAL